MPWLFRCLNEQLISFQKCSSFYLPMYPLESWVSPTRSKMLQLYLRVQFHYSPAGRVSEQLWGKGLGCKAGLNAVISRESALTLYRALSQVWAVAWIPISLTLHIGASPWEPGRNPFRNTQEGIQVFVNVRVMGEQAQASHSSRLEATAI